MVLPKIYLMKPSMLVNILKVYQLVLKKEVLRNFSSQKIKIPGISPKSPQKEAFKRFSFSF